MLCLSRESTYWSGFSCYIITLDLLQTVMMLYSIARGNDLRMTCVDVCTNEVSLLNTQQPILWDYTVLAA